MIIYDGFVKRLSAGAEARIFFATMSSEEIPDRLDVGNPAEQQE
jgi:hypothetical protein